jgi:hypothetical protein
LSISSYFRGYNKIMAGRHLINIFLTDSDVSVDRESRNLVPTIHGCSGSIVSGVAVFVALLKTIE